MATRYWVGNSGNWRDTSHWSGVSGGLGGASIPTASDAVVFDANSLSTDSTVNLNGVSDTFPMASLDMSGVDQTVSFTKDAGIDLAEFVISSSAYYKAASFAQNISSRFIGTGTISQSGGRIQRVTIITTGTIELATDITGVGFNQIDLFKGAFRTNGYSVEASLIRTQGAYGGARTLDISNSVINVSNLFLPAFYVPNTTFISAGSTVNMTGVTFTAGTFNYNIVNIDSTVTTISGSPTFSTLSVAPGTQINIDTSGQAVPVITANTYDLVGTESDPIVIRSTTPGVQHAWKKTSGTVAAEFLDLKDSSAFGGATFNNYRGTDSGNNAGWNFTGPTVPVANFNQSATSGVRSLTVNFTDTSTGGIEEWDWDFGDGDTSTAQNPSHTFDYPGTYTVSLTVTNELGEDTKTKTNLITITAFRHTRSATGTIRLGGTATRTALFYRSATGAISLSGSAYGVIRSDFDAIDKKRYLAKVYDEDGNYQETWRDVVSDPTYSYEINELGSSMILELARNSDSLGQTTAPLQTEAGTTITTEAGSPLYATTTSRNQIGEGSTVRHNNRVDIYVYYGEVSPLLTESGEEILTEDGEQLLAQTGAPSGKRIFSGFISEINTRYGSEESTIVQLMSYGFDLGQFILDNTDGETTVTFNSYDPSDIAKAALDRFQTVSASYGTYTTYTAGSIPDTGTTVSYTFKVNTYAEVLQKALELMPSNWYFRVGLGDNTVYFNERAETAKHVFYLGKHLESVDLRSYTGESYNDVPVVGGGDPALYVRRTEAPAAGTRRTLHRYTDSRITVQESAEIIADGLIGDKNKVQYRTTISVVSGQYDIETIDVGDMVGFRNFGNFVDGLLMQVVGLTYTPDKVTLQLDSLPRTVNKRLEDIRRNLVISDSQYVPVEPAA